MDLESHISDAQISSGISKASFLERANCLRLLEFEMLQCDRTGSSMQFNVFPHLEGSPHLDPGNFENAGVGPQALADLGMPARGHQGCGR